MSIPGDRLKWSRKHVKMTQSELGQDICTKAYISQIETGKQNLSIELATILKEKINNRANQLGLDFNISIEYFFESEEDILNRQVKSILEKVNRLTNEDRKKLLGELKKMLDENFDILQQDIKIESLLIVQRYLYESEIYSEALNLAEKGYSEVKNGNDINLKIKFLLRISGIKIQQKELEEAISIIREVKQLDVNNNFSSFIYTQELLIYRKKEDNNKIILLLKGNDNLTLDEMNILGNAYIVTKNFYDAELILKTLLDRAIKENDKEFICLAYRNISEIFFKSKNLNDAIYYIEQRILLDYSNYLENHLIHAAELYISVDIKKSYEYLNQAKKLIDENKNENNDIINELYICKLKQNIYTSNDSNIIKLTQYLVKNKVDKDLFMNNVCCYALDSNNIRIKNLAKSLLKND